jgi:hypothetical protein
VLPPFDAAGNLPPGIHWPTWREFIERFGTTPQRLQLIAGLKEALLFIAGSPADLAGRTFLDFFQQDRDGNARGLVAFDLQAVTL